MPRASRASTGKAVVKTKPTEPEGDEEEEFVIEKIVYKRTYKGQNYYMIKWQTFDDSQNTWEPASNLHKDLVAEFERDLKAGLVKLELPETAPAFVPPDGGAYEEDGDEDENYSEKELDDEEEEYEGSSDEGGKRKRKGKGTPTSAKRGKKPATNGAAKKGVTVKKSSSPLPTNVTESPAANVLGNQQVRSTTGGGGGRGRGVSDVQMIFPEGTYVLREADFRLKKHERPYLKDGIPIWRVDNRHLIQLYQRKEAEKFTTYVRTDLYDSWVCTDSTGLHQLNVVTVQRANGRDAEVNVEIVPEWLTRIRQYDIDESVDFTPPVGGAANANKENEEDASADAEEWADEGGDDDEEGEDEEEGEEGDEEGEDE